MFEINNYKRYQSGLSIEYLYPKKKDGFCDCGCGKKLVGRQTRWSNKECNEKAIYQIELLKGDPFTTRHYLFKNEKGFCRICGVFDRYWQADHIIPVHKGGGGLGINNMQTLCESCHKDKTKNDVKKHTN